jgi:multidrug resistance efflux pump
MPSTLLLIAGALFGAQPAASSPSAARSDQARLEHCVVSLIDHIDLPAEEEGTLVELKVREGYRVKKGDVLGKIDDTEALVRRKAAENMVAVATEKATNNAPVQVAEKLIEYYKAEYEESEELNKRTPGIIPRPTVRKQLVMWEKSVLDHIVERMNFKIAGLERQVEAAKAEQIDIELHHRTLKAPFDGVVEKLYRQQSEWVKPGDPVLRLERMDRLRVEGFVKASEVGPEEVDGADVEISVFLAGEAVEKLHGKIDYVSSSIESDGSYRVWADVDNPPGRGDYPWRLRPGNDAEMVIKLKRIPATATAARGPRG